MNNVPGEKPRGVASRGPPRAPPRLSVALARLVDLKAALLAEARARGPDGPRMRVPQLEGGGGELEQAWAQ